MVLSGNSTQTNLSRSNAVVSLSGKEQISPVLLLPDSAPDNHSDIEMASVIRSSLRSRKKSSEKSISPVPVTNSTPFFSLAEYLAKNPCDHLNTMPLQCLQCYQSFGSSAELQGHQMSHQPVSNVHTKPVISKKRQSTDEPIAKKRIKRSSSPERYFVFDADSMPQISSNGEKSFKCDICNQLFPLSESEELKIHYLRTHMNYQFISSSDRVLCSIVDDGLKSKLTDLIYRCYFCNVSCADKQVLIDHHAEHKSNIYRCDHCHSVFYQNKAFNNHLKSCAKQSKQTSVLCRHCKEPTYVEDTDMHTREFHCYVNGIVRVECMYGCTKKMKRLLELYKHYATIHRDVYFSCVLCKVRFFNADELAAHNKAVHDIESPITTGASKAKPLVSEKKVPTPEPSKTEKLAVKKPKPKPTCDESPLAPSSNKSHVAPSSSSSTMSKLSSKQRHFQDILFKSILKIDLVEQVNVLKSHAVQYPDMVQLPNAPLFRQPYVANPEQEGQPYLMEEEMVRPVFSSSQENHVYICKACGRKCITLIDMKTHMTAAHPYIQNDYYLFNWNNLPTDFWSLVAVQANSKNSANVRAYVRHRCTCCGFECKERPDFHKHLLNCAKKPKQRSPVKKARRLVRKREVSTEMAKRPMVITGAPRHVPDDILYSYKKKLEKTIKKPGDSETLFNMLNKLPSKRLVKTTERYDALYYKNNKAMKPKRSSMEKVVLVSENQEDFTLSDYVKNFSYHNDEQELNETEDNQHEVPGKEEHLEFNIPVDKNKMHKHFCQMVKRKLDGSSCNEEANKIDKKKLVKPIFQLEFNKIDKKKFDKSNCQEEANKIDKKKLVKPIFQLEVNKIDQKKIDKSNCQEEANKIDKKKLDKPIFHLELNKTEKKKINKPNCQEMVNKMDKKKIEPICQEEVLKVHKKKFDKPQEQANKLTPDIKLRIPKPIQLNLKDVQGFVESKLKPPKSNAVEESSSKPTNTLEKKLKVPKVDEKKCNGTSVLKKVGRATYTLPNDSPCKSLHNIKVVPIHYPTMSNVQSKPLAHINTKCKTKVNNKANKKALVEKKGKRAKGKVKKAVSKIAEKKLNGVCKSKMNGDSQPVGVGLLAPRRKKTIVIISDNPIRLTAIRKDRKK